MTPIAQPTPFLATLTDREIEKALAGKRAAVDECRGEIERLNAELTGLTREFLTLDQEQRRRRAETQKA